ncbi:MAG: S1C family serine protease [Defluviitaleaceae bacterium]|nr:S1C family serine protease [Defluviitaleaceae bacterium]
MKKALISAFALMCLIIATKSVSAEITEAAPLTPPQIFAQNANAVFAIYTSTCGEWFYHAGSGFFVCETGIAVTNHHVIVGAPYAFILTHNGREFDILGYYSYDIDNDLAIIRVAGRRTFDFVSIGDYSGLNIGDSVYAIGSPRGHHNTFSSGIVSRFVPEFISDDIYVVHDIIQHTAPTSPGSSGGALFDTYGRLVGVTSFMYFGNGNQALNFAVPSSRIDLTAVLGGELNALPIGDAPAPVLTSTLYGEWIWDFGYYIFNRDGTGRRDWSGVRNEFYWYMDGSLVVLEIDDDWDERWVVVSLEEELITIGGALFVRIGDAPYMCESTIALIGTWNWAGGYYTFNLDRSGIRSWGGLFAIFSWNVDGGELVILLPGSGVGDEERWTLTLVDEDKIIVGGADFTRAQVRRSKVYPWH